MKNGKAKTPLSPAQIEAVNNWLALGNPQINQLLAATAKAGAR